MAHSSCSATCRRSRRSIWIALIAAFAPDAIVVPVHEGKQGNPVLWPARFFPELLQLDGDAGAKRLIGTHAAHVREVDLGTDAIFADIDTPEALARLRRTRLVGCTPARVIPGLSRDPAFSKHLSESMDGSARDKPGHDSVYFLFSRAIRLEVSQRLPPIFCTSA